MKKLFIICTLAILAIAFSQRAVSQIQIGPTHKFTGDRLSFTPFYDYFPISGKSFCGPGGIFDDLVHDLAEQTSFDSQMYCMSTYEDAVHTGAKGQSDIALGIYTDTSLYEDWKIIYPAAIDNPVHLVMTPSRISEVKSIDDLTNLKGAISAHDHFTDFVTEQLKNFNLETIDDSEELYRKLISGEIDYIFITYWYGMAEVLKQGIQEMVSFSKKSIWNMPLFIGISKMSRGREFLSHYLTQQMEQKEYRNKIKERALNILQQIRDEYRGTVPASYNPNTPNM